MLFVRTASTLRSHDVVVEQALVAMGGLVADNVFSMDKYLSGGKERATDDVICAMCVELSRELGAIIELYEATQLALRNRLDAAMSNVPEIESSDILYLHTLESKLSWVQKIERAMMESIKLFFAASRAVTSIHRTFSTQSPVAAGRCGWALDNLHRIQSEIKVANATALAIRPEIERLFGDGA